MELSEEIKIPEVVKLKEELKSKFIPTATYTGKQILHILEGFSLRSLVKPATPPTEIRKGDIILTKTTSKVRPAVVIKVLKNRTVIYIHLTSTENIHCMTPFKSRFSKDGCFSHGFSICTEEYAIENFTGVLDNPKAVNQAIKDLKIFFNSNL